MKKNFWWLMVVFVFVAGLLVSNMIVQAKENIIEVQWEYKTVIINFANPKYSDKYKKPTYKKPTRRILDEDLSMLNEHGKDG